MGMGYFEINTRFKDLEGPLPLIKKGQTITIAFMGGAAVKGLSVVNVSFSNGTFDCNYYTGPLSVSVFGYYFFVGGLGGNVDQVRVVKGDGKVIIDN